MKNAIIIDIDNCWMDSRLWLTNAPMWSKNEEDWEMFYRKVYLCKPNKLFINDIMTVANDAEVDARPRLVISNAIRGYAITRSKFCWKALLALRRLPAESTT